MFLKPKSYSGKYNSSENLGIYSILNGPRREKTCLSGVTKDTGADQTAHWRGLISAFVISFLESTISELASSKISNF